MEPYYKNDNVTLYHGDCLDIMPELDEVFDACITDPPYSTTECAWDTAIPFIPMWAQLERLVKPGGAICLFGTEPFSSALRMSNPKKFRYDWIWEKNHSANFAQAPYMPLKVHEIISVFSDGTIAQNSKVRMTYNPQGTVECEIAMKGKTANDHRPNRSTQDDYVQRRTNYPTSILHFGFASGLHPTQKPVDLMEYLVKTYTDEGGLVLDFTAGSGSTGVACMHTDRRCVLIEKEEKYCEVIRERLENDSFQMELF